jgi:hypothetical protein
MYFLVLCLLTTRARQLTLVGRWRPELQQFAQSAGSGLMEGGSQGALDGLQIGASAVMALGENASQQLIHLPRNFLMDCSSAFFLRRPAAL